MVNSLKNGIENNSRRLEGEIEELKDLSLKLIKERNQNQFEVEKLRKRVANSHYQNLVHKENILGLFSRDCSSSVFGNYYLPQRHGLCNSKGCKSCPVQQRMAGNICQHRNPCSNTGASDTYQTGPLRKGLCNCFKDQQTLGSRTGNVESQNDWGVFSEPKSGNINPERLDTNLRDIKSKFRYKISNISEYNIGYMDQEYDPLNFDSPLNLHNKPAPTFKPMKPTFQKRVGNPAHDWDLESEFPKSSKQKLKRRVKRGQSKIKDLLRLRKNKDLYNRVYSRKFDIDVGYKLFADRGIDPNELLQLHKASDTESLMQKNNVYLKYLLDHQTSKKRLHETNYLGEVRDLYR